MLKPIGIEDDGTFPGRVGTALTTLAQNANADALAGKAPAAAGVPTGGSAGQVLAKNTATNYDVAWVNQSGGTGETFDQFAYQKLGPLFAGYAMRKTTPVGVVFIGSSTVAGTGVTADQRFVNKLVGHMQTNYPSGTGSESAVGTLSTARITTAGIHGYNGGVGGTTTTNYIDDAKVTQIGNLQPRMVFHSIGSNDFANGVAPATYKANLISWLNKLDAAVPAPYVNVLMHQQPRADVASPAYPWSDYAEILRQLGEERANCLYLNVVPAYEAVALTGADPLNLLSTDNVHMTAPGHDMLARLLGGHLHAKTSGAEDEPTTTVRHTPFIVRYVNGAWEYTSLTAAVTAGLVETQVVWFIGNTGGTAPTWARTGDVWTEA